MFTFTMDERFNAKGGYIGKLRMGGTCGGHLNFFFFKHDSIFAFCIIFQKSDNTGTCIWNYYGNICIVGTPLLTH